MAADLSPDFRVDLRQLKRGLAENKQTLQAAVKAARRTVAARLAEIVKAETPVASGKLKSTVKGITAAAKVGSKAAPYAWAAFWSSAQVQNAGYETGPRGAPHGFLFAGYRDDVREELTDLMRDELAEVVGKLNAA